MAELQESNSSGPRIAPDGDSTDAALTSNALSMFLHSRQRDGELIDDPLVFDAPGEAEIHPDDPLHLPAHGKTSTSVPITVVAPKHPFDYRIFGTPKRYSPWFWNREGVGILPTSIIYLFGIVSFPAVVLFLLLIIRLKEPQLDKTPTHTYNLLIVLTYFIIGYVTIVFWVLVSQLCVCVNEIRQKGSLTLFHDQLFSGFCLIIGILIASLGWIYFRCVSVANVALNLDRFGIDSASEYLYAWSTGIMPKLSEPQRCVVRVALQQSPLFASHIYNSQFARTYYTPECGWLYLYPPFDWNRSRSIQSDQNLCHRGFDGNTDLYGLGIRAGLYLQWISSLLANNFQSATRQDMQKVYLIFSLAICLATIIISFNSSCVFGIEIEIMYIIYWVGKWVPIDWTSTILFATHWAMTYHGIWYTWYAHDQVFPRMPCGTYHFFFAPVLDPSTAYWTLRDCLTILTVFWVVPVVVIFPLTALLLIPEVKEAIVSSATYRNFLPDEEEEFVIPTTSNSKVSLRFRFYSLFSTIQGKFRMIFLLPAESRGGICLVTPADVKQRRYLRVRWAITGLLSWVLSITAIELLLKWNKVQGIHSVDTTGQYIPLIVGLGSFVSVCWSLVQQEGERRRRWRHRQIVAAECGEEIELQSLGNAISHAFSQPDDEFLTMSGALPVFEDNAEEDTADIGIAL